MLIFATDLVDTEFIPSPYVDDQGYATAVARFQSQMGALEAQQKLHGKPNSTKETNMIVEVHSGGTMNAYERRNTIDGTTSRTQTSSASSAGSISGPPNRSRYAASYQHNDAMSPPLPTPSSGGSGEFPVPETSTRFQTLFSLQSPLANGMDDRHRVSGKYTINHDAVDDETGELLRDPVGYAQSGQQQASGRRPTQIPIARFNGLSLNTTNGNGGNVSSSPPNGINLRRGAVPMQSPISPTNGTNGTFLNYPRAQYPPVNPADQHPPCNTLYVGNLPIDTSEDELKALFSKQRGYKRLCFRPKQTGPMCFVEFEDVSFATKALNDLYGQPLHNSVKGGIRLSFSKNPLGVRSGQTNGYVRRYSLVSQIFSYVWNAVCRHHFRLLSRDMLTSQHRPNPPMNPHAMAPGFGINPSANFSAVSGPPPGLAAPPGLYRAPPPQAAMESMFANPFGMPPQEFASPPPAPQRGAPISRERNGYTDFMLGR